MAICLMSSMPVVTNRWLQRSIRGVECQRNKRLEAVGFVLQSAQADEMVGAVFFIFNVAIEHGRV